MTVHGKWHFSNRVSAFSLIEMMAVIAVVSILVVVGGGILRSNRNHALRSGTDMLTGMIEQARATASASRCQVVLGIAEPGDLPMDDVHCRIGIFKVETWPEGGVGPVIAIPINRWQPLENGVILIGGDVGGLQNPMDCKELEIRYGRNKPTNVKVHAISFGPRGGIEYPPGSAPLVLRLAEGSYRSGKASPERQETSGNTLKIGRVTARCYQTN